MAAATEGVDKDLEIEEERCNQQRTLLARKLEISVPTLSPATLKLEGWHLPPRAVQAVSRSACCAYS